MDSRWSRQQRCYGKRVTGAQLSVEDVEAFDSEWRSRRPNDRPIGTELRCSASSTWVRFHSLPGSKRYADNQAEYDELHSRHHTLISELSAIAGTSVNDLRAVTPSFSGSPRPVDRHDALAAAMPSAAYWKTLPQDLSDPEDPCWIHLHLAKTSLHANDLRELLLLVADFGTGEVVLCPPTLEWLYHPYDGGCDVIAPDRAAVELLRTRHADWLSSDPSGL